MAFQGIIELVTRLLGWVSDKLPNFPLDTSGLGTSFKYVMDVAEQLNRVLPLSEAIVFVGVLISIRLVMMIFWAAMRVINLIRGAG